MLRWCRGQGLDRIATADVIQDSWMSVARGLASFRSQPGAGAFRAGSTKSCVAGLRIIAEKMGFVRQP